MMLTAIVEYGVAAACANGLVLSAAAGAVVRVVLIGVEVPALLFVVHCVNRNYRAL